MEVILPVTMYGSIETGMRAVVEPELPNSKRYVATVSSVDRVLDGSSGTFGARLLLPNPDYALPGGLRCRLRPLEKGEIPPAGAVDTTPPPPAPLEEPRDMPAPPVETVVSAEPVHEPAPEQNTKPLREPAPQRHTEQVAAAVSTPPNARVCGSVGPIRTDAQSDRLSKALASRVTQVSRRVEKPSRLTRYLVLTPRQQSVADAKRLAAELQQRGVQHLRAVPRGPYKGHVSLGLFLTKANAEKHRDNLAKQGIEAMVKARYREQRRTWLDLEFPGRNLDGVNRVLRKSGPGLSLTPADCPRLKTAQK